MGTFEFRPFSLFSRDNGIKNWGASNGVGNLYPATDNQLLVGVGPTAALTYIYYTNDAAVATGRLVFLGRWYLDGSSSPLDINHLPAGILISSANWSMISDPNWNAYTGAAKKYFAEFADVIEAELPYPNNVLNTIALSTPTIIKIDAFLSFKVQNIINDGNFPTFGSLKISGNYTLWSFTYTINTPTISTKGPNNKPQVISTYPAANALNLAGIVTNGITQSANGSGGGSYNALSDTGIAGIGLVWVNLAGIAQYYFIPLRYIGISFVKRGFQPFQPTLLEFEIPPALALLIWQDPTIPGWPNIPMDWWIYGNGTQFSGWVKLGSLTVTLADASGIYRLVKDKTNDTLYDNLNPPNKSDVKIPNPFIKTGFVGG